VSASNVRGNAPDYSPDNTLDPDPTTYWSTDDGVTRAWLEINTGGEVELNRLLVQEQIQLGQRVKKFSIAIWKEGRYETVAAGTTIGYKRILLFPMVKTNRLRLMIDEAKASPAISNIELYGVH